MSVPVDQIVKHLEEMRQFAKDEKTAAIAEAIAFDHDHPELSHGDGTHTERVTHNRSTCRNDGS